MEQVKEDPRSDSPASFDMSIFKGVPTPRRRMENKTPPRQPFFVLEKSNLSNMSLCADPHEKKITTTSIGCSESNETLPDLLLEMPKKTIERDSAKCDVLEFENYVAGVTQNVMSGESCSTSNGLGLISRSRGTSRSRDFRNPEASRSCRMRSVTPSRWPLHYHNQATTKPIVAFGSTVTPNPRKPVEPGQKIDVDFRNYPAPSHATPRYREVTVPFTPKLAKRPLRFGKFEKRNDFVPPAPVNRKKLSKREEEDLINRLYYKAVSRRGNTVEKL